jgi:hypothetical protein
MTTATRAIPRGDLPRSADGPQSHMRGPLRLQQWKDGEGDGACSQPHREFY